MSIYVVFNARNTETPDALDLRLRLLALGVPSDHLSLEYNRIELLSHLPPAGCGLYFRGRDETATIGIRTGFVAPFDCPRTLIALFIYDRQSAITLFKGNNVE